MRGQPGRRAAPVDAESRPRLHGRYRLSATRNPDELVSPDVAFVRHDRLPPPAGRTSYLRVVPDLVVEVRSPNDREADVRARIDLYTSAGVPLIWLVDPQQETVEELGTLAVDPPRLLRASCADELNGGDLMPGCRISLAEVFD